MTRKSLVRLSPSRSAFWTIAALMHFFFLDCMMVKQLLSVTSSCKSEYIAGEEVGGDSLLRFHFVLQPNETLATGASFPRPCQAEIRTPLPPNS